MPDLDLWVLLTTQRLNDQAYSSLKQIAHEHGIEFLSIDVENEENSDLAAKKTRQWAAQLKPIGRAR